MKFKLEEKLKIAAHPIEAVNEMQNKTGINMQNVHVHYHSSKPSLFSAAAVTYGNDIYLAHGQEKELQHELGHVIQQKRGIVPIEGYVKGYPINQNVALEKSADQISFGMPKIQHVNEKKVIQCRLLQFKPDKKTQDFDEEENSMYTKAKIIDETLQDSYNRFINEDFTLASQTYRISYLKCLNDYHDGGKMHPAAAAGSLIENMVNNQLKSDPELIVQDHQTFRHSIPDFTIILSKYERKGLVDITAENSKRHILSKQGNWTGPPFSYVAEALYPSLSFSRDGKITSVTPENLEILQDKYDEIIIQERLIEESKRKNFRNNRELLCASINEFDKERYVLVNKRELDDSVDKLSIYGVKIDYQLEGDPYHPDVIINVLDVLGFSDLYEDYQTYSILNCDSEVKQIVFKIQTGVFFGSKHRRELRQQISEY